MGSGRLSCPERAWIVKRRANVANLETPEIAQTIGLMRMWTCVCVFLRGSCCCQKRQITQGEDTMHTLVHTHTHTHSHLYMESISKIQDVNSDNNKLWDSLPGKQRITIKCKDQLGKFISQNYSANNNKAPSGKGSGKGRGKKQRQRSGSSRVPRFIWTRQGRRTHVGMLIVTCSSCLFSASLAESLTDGRQGRRRAQQEPKVFGK